MSEGKPAEIADVVEGESVVLRPEQHYLLLQDAYSARNAPDVVRPSTAPYVKPRRNLHFRSKHIGYE